MYNFIDILNLLPSKCFQRLSYESNISVPGKNISKGYRTGLVFIFILLLLLLVLNDINSCVSI